MGAFGIVIRAPRGERGAGRMQDWQQGLVQDFFPQAADDAFVEGILGQPAWVEGGPEPTTVKDSAFLPERLETPTSRLSAAYKGVHALLMHKQARDFLSGQSYKLEPFWVLDGPTKVERHILSRKRPA